MTNPLTRKLQQFTELSDKDHAVLDRAAAARVRHFEPNTDIIREGDRPRDVNLFLSGWACRYKQMEDGRRQIVAFFLPGDLCDHNVFILRAMDHSIGALTAVSVAELAPDAFERMTLDHPCITRALWWETLVNTAVQREWTINLGQRDAFERVAHLFCELFYRLAAIGMTVGASFSLPLTQLELGYATGLSSVHVNRTLQQLRAAKLIVLRGKVLTIPDLELLMRAGIFTPGYLHLDREGYAQDRQR